MRVKTELFHSHEATETTVAPSADLPYSDVQSALEYLATTGGGAGTVSSVNVAVSGAGLSSSGGPITTSGTITLTVDGDLATWSALTPSADAQSFVTAANYAAMRGLLDLEAGTDFLAPAAIAAAYQPLDADLTTLAGLASTDSNFIVGSATGWVVESGATARASLGLGSMATETATNYLTTAAAASGYQPLDADLTAWATVNPSSYLTTAQIAAAYQPLDGDLTTIGGLSSTDGNFIVGSPTGWVVESGATVRTSLGLGTMATETAANYLTTAAVAAAYQPLDADLTTWAGVTSSANGRSLVSAADYAAMRGLLDLEAGTDFLAPAAIAAAYQPLDADITAIAGLTSAANKVAYYTGPGAAALADFTAAGRSMVGAASAAAQTALLSAFVGDAGAGGTKGLVPAPATGDATKLLRGDGTWVAVSGAGDVVKVGNPVNNQVGVWTGDGSLEGDPALTFDTATDTLACGSLRTAPGTTAIAPIQLQSGTNLTTPAAGALEYDGKVFYGSHVASARGVVAVEQFASLTANRTLTSTTNQQAIFDAANDTLTVTAATTYFFQALLHISGMSATSGNFTFSIVGGGTATFTSAKWVARGLDSTTPTTAAAGGSSLGTSATGTGNIVTAATGTAVAVSIDGIFRVNAGGTIIPSVGLTTAAAATMEVNSYFTCRPVGSNTVAAVGQWA